MARSAAPSKKSTSSSKSKAPPKSKSSSAAAPLPLANPSSSSSSSSLKKLPKFQKKKENSGPPPLSQASVSPSRWQLGRPFTLFPPDAVADLKSSPTTLCARYIRYVEEKIQGIFFFLVSFFSLDTNITLIFSGSGCETV